MNIKLWLYHLPVTADAPGLPGGARKGLLIGRVIDRQPCRIGEAAPLPGFSPESLEEVVAWIQNHSADLTDPNLDLTRIPYPSLACAVDQLCSDTEPAADAQIETAALLGTLSPPLINAWRAAADRGFRCFKVKAGHGSMEQEQDGLQKLLNTMPASQRLRVDMNRRGSPETVRRLFAGLAEYPQLECVEEPPIPLSEWSEWMHRYQLPFALDETTRECTPDEIPAALNPAAVVIKPMLLGGRPEQDRWLRFAEEKQCPVIYSSSYESGVGMTYLVKRCMQAAGSIAAGLDTARYMKADTLKNRLQIGSPVLTLKTLCITEDDLNVEPLEAVSL